MDAEDVLLWEAERARRALEAAGRRVRVLALEESGPGVPQAGTVSRVVRARSLGEVVELSVAAFPAARSAVP
ncbi:MAG: hypothetical protein IMW98_05285 [Firmicutes bacterium]|nr:hypothetical protein [Bacillota bacterium]